MNIDFQEILKELEYRVPHGIINLNEDSQVTTLVDILRENGVSDANELAQKARGYFGFINEANTNPKPTPKPKKKETPKKASKPSVSDQAKKQGLEGKGGTAYGPIGKDVVTHINQKGTLVKKEKPEPIGKPAKTSTQGKKPEPKQLGGIELKTDLEKEKEKTKKNVKVQQYNSNKGVEQMSASDGTSFDGYRTGKTSAAGTAPGAFPEVGGMLIAGYLRQNPNASDEELTKYMGDWAKKGKVTKSPSVSGGDKMTAAVHTGKAIYEATNIISSEEGYDSKTTIVEGYWGAGDSKLNALKRLDEIIKKNPKATFNGLNAEEYKKIIKENGAGENPTDSMAMIWDGKSNNVSFLHISNKVGSNNIQANSSVKQTFTRVLSIVDESDLDSKQKEIAKNKIAANQKNVVSIQKEQINYQTSFLPKFSKLTSSEKILKEITKDIYDDSETAKVRRGKDVDKLFTPKTGIGKECKKMQKPHPSCKLVGKENAKPEQKVKAMFEFYKENTDLAPASVREVISRVATLKGKDGKEKYNIGYKPEVINQLYGKMNDEIENMRQSMNKIKPGFGDKMLAKDFASRLHLTLAEGHNPGGIPHDRFILVMGNNEADIWYDKDGQAYEKSKNQYYKVNDDGSLDKDAAKLSQKDVNRGSIATIGDSENFKHCLGVPEGEKIEDFTNVKYDKIDTKTGIQKAHMFDINNKEIGIMMVRSKQGPGGDAADTLQFSKGMQNCLQKQEYLKKRKGK